MLWIIAPGLEWSENTYVSNLYRKSGSFISVNREFTFIGFHNKSIFILGGYGIGGDVFLEFDTVTQSYSSHENAITFGYQFGQSFIQHETKLFMLPYRKKIIIVFDLKSLSLSTQLTCTYSPVTSYPLGRCLTYINKYLLIIGGFDYPDITYSEVYIYDTVDQSWSDGPSLLSARYYHSCNTVANTIYVIGGTNHTHALNDVLFLTVNNNNISGTWVQMNATLTSAKYQHHSIVYKTYIYIIGGRNDTNVILDEVDLINTETDSIQHNSYMIHPQYSVSAIVLGSTIYTFDGVETETVRYMSQSATNHYQLSILTHSPTYSPTNAPTFLPSNSPTFPPSNAPTYSPSNAPTYSPTRFPTSITEYNQQLDGVYELHNLFQYNVDRLSLYIVKANIVPIIETSYINAAQENGQTLQYREFEIIVNDFNFFKVNPGKNNNYTLKMNCSILYADDAVSVLIEFISYQYDFVTDAETSFRRYFDKKDVTFNANILSFAPRGPTIVISPSTTFHYVFVLLLIFISCVCLGSIAAFMYNKKAGTSIDDSSWTSLINTGLHFVDFISDINLTIEILLQFGNDDKIGSEQLLYIAGIGSVLFIILPYLVNILIALKVETFLSGSIIAVMYFKQHRGLFVLLVLLTGSAHCALTLLSSRIFGLELFNSGLTKYELQKLSGLKLFAGTLFENLPQLVCQIIYVVYAQGALSQNTVLSFVASFLSVVAAIISYWLERKSSDQCSVAQYELEIKKDVLSDDDKVRILQRKECKKELTRSLAATLNIEDSVLEFGYIKMNNFGFEVHVIHYVFNTDLVLLDNSNENEWICKLYKTNQEQVNETFSLHFGLDVEVAIKSNIKRNVELQESQNLLSLAYHIDALFKKNMSIERVQNELIKEGHNKELIVSVISTYYSEKRKHKSSNSEVGDCYFLMRDDSA